MSATHQILYFPFCQEGYWPTVYDAIEKMHEICRNGRKIDVYLALDDAIHVAETTVFDDETWIVVEIEINGDQSFARIAHDKGWADVEFDSWLVQHFNVQTSV
jgi:hypothetical protein